LPTPVSIFRFYFQSKIKKPVRFNWLFHCRKPDVRRREIPFSQDGRSVENTAFLPPAVSSSPATQIRWLRRGFKWSAKQTGGGAFDLPLAERLWRRTDENLSNINRSALNSRDSTHF